ncbi:MAG TPA: hypothetical protein VNA20_00425 [Frankiaceae bacterium]|nr:hypothetical protein [Frankiaceae bacterium]
MLRWAVRQPRVWASVLAVGVVAVLAAPDGRAHFLRFAPLAMLAAVAAIRQKYAEDFPDRLVMREERRRQRFEDEVARILRRDAERRGVPPPPGPSPEPPAAERPRGRAARRAARQQAEVEAILWRYERARLARERARR